MTTEPTSEATTRSREIERCPVRMTSSDQPRGPLFNTEELDARATRPPSLRTRSIRATIGDPARSRRRNSAETEGVNARTPGLAWAAEATPSRLARSWLIEAAAVNAIRRVWSPSSAVRSRNVLIPAHTAAASSGTSSRPMAIASCRWSERDQKGRIFSFLSAQDRVCHTRLREAGRTKCATVATAAWATIRPWVVATMRQAVVQPEVASHANDLRLRQRLQWGVDPERGSLYTLRSGQRRQPLERGDIFRPAIGIAGIIERVDANEDIARAKHLRPPQGE